MRTALAALLAGALAAGCALPSKPRTIVSARATDADTAPKRVFIVSHLLNKQSGPNFGPLFGKGFEGRIDAALRRCGIETFGFGFTGVALNEDAGKLLEAFRPDAVLVLRRTAGTVNQYGSLVRAT